MQPQAFHCRRVPSAEPGIIFSGSRRRAGGIDQLTLCNHAPMAHFFAYEDFSNLRPCVHFLFSPEELRRAPFLCKLRGRRLLDQGTNFPVPAAICALAAHDWGPDLRPLILGSE